VQNRCKIVRKEGKEQNRTRKAAKVRSKGEANNKQGKQSK